MCGQKINHEEQYVTSAFNVKGHSHNAKMHLNHDILQNIDQRDLILHDITNHGQQNVTLIFKVKGQGNSANAPKL